VGPLGAGRYWLIWAAVLPIAIWALARAFGVEGGFPIVPLLVYTPYVAALSIPVLGLAAVSRNWAATGLASLATICLLAVLAVLAPRVFGGGQDLPPGDRELRVLSANIHLGQADVSALMQTIARLRPDVIDIQELTPHFAQELAFAGIGSRYPHAVLSVRARASGGGIYSRLPLRRLPAPPQAAFRMPRALVTVAPHRYVGIVDVHPYPPRRSSIQLWREGLDTLPTDASGPPLWVLAGDFNASLDFSELRAILDNGYRDAGEATGDGLEPTWPQGRVLPPPVTIDHILAADPIAILDYSVQGDPGSDHRAVFASLGVPGPQPSAAGG
jgi:endonuclease/exonuclease/phosphatase (EEP) superfamily protein YafD